jgi:hypothetical protein
MAGLACATALVGAGLHEVVVLERSAGAGGRMATKWIDGRYVDLGAAYFTVDDPEFAVLVDGWQARGLVRPWTDTMQVYDRTGWSTTRGPMRMAAPGGLRSLVDDLCENLSVHPGHPVQRVGTGPTVDGLPVDVVVLAMPDPQALRLLDPELTEAHRVLTGRRWEPSLAATLAYPRRLWAPFGAAFVNDHDRIDLLADDGDRRGDGAPVLVAHTTAAFAHEYLDRTTEAGPPIAAAVSELLDIARPAMVHVHRWTFARPEHGRDQTYHLDLDGIGLAGDGWGSPKVQTAWRSGTDLGRAVAAALLEPPTAGSHAGGPDPGWSPTPSGGAHAAPDGPGPGWSRTGGAHAGPH